MVRIIKIYLYIESMFRSRFLPVDTTISIRHDNTTTMMASTTRSLGGNHFLWWRNLHGSPSSVFPPHITTRGNFLPCPLDPPPLAAHLLHSIQPGLPSSRVNTLHLTRFSSTLCACGHPPVSTAKQCSICCCASVFCAPLSLWLLLD